MKTKIFNFIGGVKPKPEPYKAEERTYPDMRVTIEEAAEAIQKLFTKPGISQEDIESSDLPFYDPAIDEAIKHEEDIAEEYEKIKCIKAVTLEERKCADKHRQLAEWLKDYKGLLEQQPCEDEYIKVPKKALKYRTAGMVAYNAEWLKNHFDIERAVIMGCEYKEQEPCEDAISREAVRHILNHEIKMPIKVWKKLFELVDDLPPVTPQPKTGHWIVHEIENTLKWLECSNCHCETSYNVMHNYCPNCGAKMQEVEE